MASWCASVDIFNTTFSLITFVSNSSDLANSLGYLFWLKKFKNDTEIALKPTDFELSENPINIYHSVYICERKRCGTTPEKFSFSRSHCFKYHKLNVVKKWAWVLYLKEVMKVWKYEYCCILAFLIRHSFTERKHFAKCLFMEHKCIKFL